MEKTGRRLKNMLEQEQEHKLDHMRKSSSIGLKDNLKITRVKIMIK